MIEISSFHFIMIGKYPWIKKRAHYLSCIEGKWGYEKHLMYFIIKRIKCFSFIKSLFLRSPDDNILLPKDLVRVRWPIWGGEGKVAYLGYKNTCNRGSINKQGNLQYMETLPFSWFPSPASNYTVDKIDWFFFRKIILRSFWSHTL